VKKHIALAGKGGTGKTTFAALTIGWLVKNGKKPVLAVDADANANLNEALGLSVSHTISEIISETKESKALPAGMSKDQFIEYRLNAALSEGKDVDLLVMGGPEGPGCYCFPNDLLRRHMEILSRNYPYLVMDNEAGLEHLSRRVARDVDVLFITSDPTVRGIRSAGRVRALVGALRLDIKEMYLVVTRAREGDLAALVPEIEAQKLTLAGTVPFDPLVSEYDLKGRALLELPDDAPSVVAVSAILKARGI